MKPIGMEIREAANGLEAIEIWENWQPHLILMDMRMPVMDGYEATRRIKSTTKGQATVIVAVTASALEEDREIILSEGCDAYVRKPFREYEIFEAMTKYLGVEFRYEELPNEEQVAEDRRSAGEDLSEIRLGRSEIERKMMEIPSDLIVHLKKAAILGNIDEILIQIEEIKNCDKELSVWLTDMAEGFQHEQILDMIQRVENHNEYKW